MRSLGWPLIQNDWYPYQRKKFEHKQRKGNMKTQGEDGHLQAKRKAWNISLPMALRGKIQPCKNLEGGVLASRTMRK